MISYIVAGPTGYVLNPEHNTSTLDVEQAFRWTAAEDAIAEAKLHNRAEVRRVTFMEVQVQMSHKYTTHYTHKISASAADRGPEVTLEVADLVNRKTLAKALREQKVLFAGERLSSFRIEPESAFRQHLFGTRSVSTQ